MIIIRLKGGLGNQIFQYGAGRALAGRHGVELRVDTSWYDDMAHQQAVRRSCDLGAFNVPWAQATRDDLAAFAWPPLDGKMERWAGCLRRRLGGRRVWVHDAMGFAEEFTTLGDQLLLEGYFQHPAYFLHIADELRRELVLREPPPASVRDFAERLSTVPSVCIQVRRTDFTANAGTAAVHGCVAPSYFRRAWARLVTEDPGVQGYVFSDEPEWAQAFFAEWCGLTVVNVRWNGPAFLHKFYLMQACRHFIIMNSTWGWWAAWLGAKTGARVIMPEEWLRGRPARELGLVCEGWEVVSGAEEL